MSVAFFQVVLSVQPKGGAEAELVLPKVLQGRNYRFVIVKDGGEEGIVKLEGPQEVIKKVEKDKGCEKLTKKQMEKQQKTYPVPKIKKRYRMRTQAPEEEVGAETATEPFEVDDKGSKIIETFQTVRSGFYLIDVPVLTEAGRT
jgi:hypothetical protein